ncbi:DUF4105 domain-containing protein [Puniceibacterium antarcticum]|uniref:Lnb N-terminal periplasmic domain-containing protein n=1 Tax=Puniceibacterium antarcticum TaxID=1206336 RepID=UPI001FE5A936|nr:DUF4105 domain-containing protein [Puniceibacterium antarcticum]
MYKDTASSQIRWPRIFGHIGFACLVLAFCAWSGIALSVHLTGAVLITAQATLAIAGLAAVLAHSRARRWGWCVAAALTICVMGWYATLKPQSDLDWAFDVARSVTADQSGEIVTLRNVRDFDWYGVSEAKERWVSRTVDLSQLQSVDMLTSVWDSPDIAHLLVSFGFSDGQRIVFSVETRKETHETFNVTGGFFRQFELVLLATTEEDAIKLRTNHRQEDVRLYPLNLNAMQRRDLFQSYVDLGNDLAQTPRFYNTVTANCTTTVYKLAQVIAPGLKLDWRLVASAHLPAYVDRMGGFAEPMPIEDRLMRAKITDRVKAYDGPHYSQVIRGLAQP